MVLRNIGLFASSRADERFSIAHEVWPRLRKPELLLLAGLFHDIAKGRGGDHSELGAVDARAFCQAHALSGTDTALVAWLVEQHLRMSVTAQKQDIADPVVIHRFATLVGSRDRLDYLYLLTCADIAGTSPKLWNAWKDRLLADLYFATRRALREGLEHPVPAAERVAEARDSVRALVREQGYDDATIDRQFAVMPDEGFIRLRPEQLAWQAAALVPVKQGQALVKVRRISVDDPALEVFVHSPDRDGLLAASVMTLDRKGYGIHRARVLDGPADTIFDTFEVNPADTFADGSSTNLEAALREALSGDLTRLRPSRRVVPRQLRHFCFAPRIEFRDEPGATRFALVAPDRPGLLADVASCMTRCWPAWTLIETPETPPDGHQARQEDRRDPEERSGQETCRRAGRKERRCAEEGRCGEGPGEEGGCTEEGPGQERRSRARRNHCPQVAAQAGRAGRGRAEVRHRERLRAPRHADPA
ncbi:hypothetical protein G6F57_014805 [Rhizopus arrhizus]|nr:hypothetical protein G6F57_014805 [Rhizopus arrhizus]